ncbi:Uncharacterized protein involved in exopolysaccharide biosynthesis [Roseivivax lentus]|uniref:Uncharacterized protein involved in exopolysaccharide biosynthesis n=1 Tax=Roseivivax lentus TaxID=633194 RepID=A0A1N7Q240_9RHOB|nr:hypothetical protein [Roseivivax lentus]SIT16963.1 Uncharacterized protein involved in exopolysaccharide biosynthesis [Roseivivax lentus]
MDDLRFYLSLFLRRLPYFLVVATIVSTISITVAVSLPPAYVSQMRLVVESPQIPEDLAASTVRTPALEQLQIIEQRLLTRANLLDLARRLQVLPNIDEMNPDEIVRAMRSRTIIETSSARSPAKMMFVSFEAPEAHKAAEVLNEYLTTILEADAEFRRGRASDTLEFFSQQVARVGDELSEASAKIIALKQENSDALPESLDFRLEKRSELQERVIQTERDISRLRGQRARLLEIYETTGRTDRLLPQEPPSLAEQQLSQAETELAQALLVFSEQNPKVKLLRGKVEVMKAEVAGEQAVVSPSDDDQPNDPQRNLINAQLDEIDAEIEQTEIQVAALQSEIAALTDSIERTPEVAAQLSALERAYELLVTQYTIAEEQVSRAQTGDLIESRSRGQRIAVIEQPNLPNAPSKPNRILIAGGGSILGLLAGLGLVVLLELLKATTIRRPEDLVARFDIVPFTTVPYILTRRQLILQRGIKASLILTILIGIPAMIYAVHVYYLPIDLLAEKLMNRLGVRW